MSSPIILDAEITEAHDMTVDTRTVVYKLYEGSFIMEMSKVKQALEEFRTAHMSAYPENERHEAARDEILETMNEEEREVYDLFVKWYFNGFRDAFERDVE